MNTQGHRGLRRRAARGFTLVEILVTMAIFITVMGGVALLFNSAIRVSEQTFQNQDAFEVARGALKILERDLNRAFTSRDTGDASNFYGTPIGMTFVGLITDRPGNDNIGRITYVIHRRAGRQNLSGVPAGDTDDPELDRRDTFALIRYVETGAEDLDSFPVDWTIQVLLDELISAPNNCVGGDVACFEEVIKAKKRELWIRMLSGEDDLPDIWSQFGPDTDDDGFPDGLDPEDYIVAENILHVSRSTGEPQPGAPNINPNDVANFDSTDLNDVIPDSVFFTYREYGQRVTPESDDLPERVVIVPIELAYWNDTRNAEYAAEVALDISNDIEIDNAEANGINLGSPLDARSPVDILVSFTLFFESPYPGAPDFNRVFEQRIDIPSGYRRAYTTPVSPDAPL